MVGAYEPSAAPRWKAETIAPSAVTAVAALTPAPASTGRAFSRMAYRHRPEDVHVLGPGDRGALEGAPSKARAPYGKCGMP